MKRALLGVLILGAGATAPGQALAATFYVDDNASAPQSPCTSPAPANACNSITDAIVQARGFSFPGGDRIVVAAGNYPEEVDMFAAADQGNVIEGAGSDPVSGTRIAPPTVDGNQALGTVVILGASTTLRGATVRVLPGPPADERDGINIVGSSVQLEDVSVFMQEASNTRLGIVAGGPVQDVTLDRVSVIGQWAGSGAGVFSGGAEATIRDSNLLGRGAFGAAISTAQGSTVLVQRSVLRRAAATEAAVRSGGESLTIESSLVAGGAQGILMNSNEAQDLTLRHTTVDAGAPGRTPTGQGVVLVGGADSAAIVDSILLEEQTAAGPGPAITCANSDVPEQVEEGNGFNGSIACGTAGGNTDTAAASLFRDFAAADYRLLPGSPAVETGSAALAPGESATDLAGNPRELDGNLDCIARSDRGAYELTGYSLECPAADVAPVISGLRAVPRRFRAAPRRRRARGSAAPVGTSFRYALSERARVTFTIARRTRGRRAGGRCRRRTRRNRDGKPCKRFVKRGTLHQDGAAGPNSLRFNGRIGKRALRRGRYRVSAVAADPGAKKSKPARAAFRVVRR